MSRFGGVDTPLPMSSPVREGDVILGKYRIESVLGMGGMGIVVCARHITLDERVAIKLLLPTLVSHPPVVARFLQEAKAAARLKSEHVARVSDFGTLDDGTPFLVMEYLDGADLEGVLRTCERFEVEEAIDYVLQVAEALAEAHRLGIVHRDLKPENLFLTEGPDGAALVKILDFGISKFESAGETTQAMNAGELLGSPAYMAPEQFQDPHSASPRSDIWALGVLLYEFITGKLPFDGSTLHAILGAVTTMEPAPLDAHIGDLPEGLSEAILECLHKDPAQRPQDVLEFADLLAPFVSENTRPRVLKIAAILRRSRASLSSVPGRTPGAVRSLGSLRAATAGASVADGALRDNTPANNEAAAPPTPAPASPSPSQWSRTTPVSLSAPPKPASSESPAQGFRARARRSGLWLGAIAAVSVTAGFFGSRAFAPTVHEPRAALAAADYAAEREDDALQLHEGTELMLRPHFPLRASRPAMQFVAPANAAGALSAPGAALPQLPSTPAVDEHVAPPDVVTGH